MVGKYPRLRTHVRKSASGKVRTYYVYDMRGTGEKDIALGTNWDEALKAWDEIHNQKPRIVGTLDEAFKRWERERLPTYRDVTRAGYAKSLKWLRAKFGKSTWDAVKLSHLSAYLEKRTAKTQANRELALLSVIWNWARTKGLTECPWPAAGMNKAKWKNSEKPREFEVTDALFAAVYEQAEPMLRDCMDLATATGMRLTDCRTVLIPSGDTLRLKASKTGKQMDFDLSLSEVLPDLVKRRKAIKADHLMLLSMPDGKPVTANMLRGAYDRARARAMVIAGLANDDAFYRSLKTMILRDCRKRAADLAANLSEASKLLQHSSEAITRTNYRTKADKVRPVR